MTNIADQEASEEVVSAGASASESSRQGCGANAGGGEPLCRRRRGQQAEKLREWAPQTESVALTDTGTGNFLIPS